LAEKISFTRDELAGLAHNGFSVALARE
jgi:hypothetical protein